MPACLFVPTVGPRTNGDTAPRGFSGRCLSKEPRRVRPAGAKKIKFVFGPGAVLMRTEDFCRRDGRVCTAASVGACRGQPSAGRLLDGGVTREGGRTSSIKRCWTACKTVQHRLNLFKQTQAPAAVKQPGPYLARETVSRVLYLTVIYLDAPLPTRSSHLLRTAGPAICPFHGVAPDRVYSDGHFRAVGCALTAPFHPYQGG